MHKVFKHICCRPLNLSIDNLRNSQINDNQAGLKIMRKTTKSLLRYYLEKLDLKGDVLEIGGHRLKKCSINEFPEPRFKYHDLNIQKIDIPNTIIGDITNVHHIADNSFDIVFSSDVFEHIDRPWLAAKEISRILKPGGISITATVWAWRNHPCPLDYWRFSPDCLKFLFSDLDTLEKGFDLSERRNNKLGTWSNGMDAVPLDKLGGWLENWAVYHVGGKQIPKEKWPKQFKESNLENSHFLNLDVQGKIDLIQQQRANYEKKLSSKKPSILKILKPIINLFK